MNGGESTEIRGTGFIGSYISDALVAAGHEVVILDNLSSGKRENVSAQARLEVMDIRSPEAAALVESLRPDALVHQAAQMDVRRSVADPLYDADVNVRGSLNLLEAAVRAGVKRVVFASTGGAIYGEQDAFPATEDHPKRPVSPYRCAKASVETYLGFYRAQYGLSSLAGLPRPLRRATGVPGQESGQPPPTNDGQCMARQGYAQDSVARRTVTPLSVGEGSRFVLLSTCQPPTQPRRPTEPIWEAR